MRCPECGSKNVVVVKIEKDLVRVICRECKAEIYLDLTFLYRDLKVESKMPSSEA
jgi:transcription elongation factor Elf1